MGRFFIPLSYNPIDVDKLADTLRNYAERHHTEIISDFEQAICNITGATYAVALSSGTAAIHLALKAVGVNTGDYVFAPTFTYVATINPILYLGARPVLIDSEPVTWNMSPELLERGLQEFARSGKLPKAIIVVHTYGMMADMEAICSIAGEWDIPVIEDAAEAVGSSLHGKAAGIWGKAGIFSFNNNKLVTSFGGGAVVTHDARLAERVRFLAAQSREQNLHYEHNEVGYNYQMGPVNAACGLASLRDLEKNVLHRQSMCQLYKQELSQFMAFPVGLKSSVSNRWLTVGLLNKQATRDKVFTDLVKNGIEARLCWKPMHRQTLYKNAEAIVNGVSEEIFEKGICLPSGSGLSASDCKSVIENIKKLM